MDFCLLGDLAVWRGGREIRLGGQQRAVLAVLLYQANAVVSRLEIVRLAWGEDPPRTVNSLVADYVSRLRTAFRDAGAGEEVVRLVAREPGYLVEVDEGWVDWHRFRVLL